MRDYDLEDLLKHYGTSGSKHLMDLKYKTYRKTYIAEPESDELAHYGVKGMRWRYKKGITIDPTNKNVRMRKPDGSVRVEKEKNLSLTGGANKRFSSSERNVEDPAERKEFTDKANEAAKKDQEDREKREESIRNAYDNALQKAKERAEELKNKTGKSSGGGGNKADTQPVNDTQSSKKIKKVSANNDDKFREINRRDREYTYRQNAINKANGIDRVNVMNDKTETDKKFKKK